jgi:formylglycine-generating enzyme required for sulfatase activity
MDADLPPEHFPPRLSHLGFQGCVIRNVEVILPPLCTVLAGPFLMGSDTTHDNEALEDEQPQHTVTLPAFEIGRFPVSVAEYACFVRAGHAEPSYWQTQLGKLDHPVVAVSWHDAVAYAAWLAQRTKEVWRLATEAEWEKAARGTDGLVYPWGNAFDKARCNTRESGVNATTPVGSYPAGASPHRVQDMAGNVWEWTSSRIRILSYLYAVSGELEDTNSPDNRVLRGGSWDDDYWFARAAFRFSNLPDYTDVFFGFRVVRAAPSS